MEGNDFVVMMVDFGNETTVQYDKLRKFPKNLKRIPILGLACDFQGKIYHILISIKYYFFIFQEFHTVSEKMFILILAKKGSW